MSTEPLHLLKMALLSPGQDDWVERVQHQAAEIRAALDHSEVEFTDEEYRTLAAHPDWTALIFQALAFPTEEAAEDNEIVLAIHELQARTDAEIGEALLLALENLPPYFRTWEYWFAEVPEAPEAYQDYLRRQLDVQQARPYSDELLPYGLTPSVFVEAARGLELLCDRLIRHALGGEEEPELSALYESVRSLRESGGLPSLDLAALGPEEEGLSLPAYYVPFPLLVAQIRGTPQCPPAAAEPLLRWIVEVAQLRPFLISGYVATGLSKYSIRLVQQPTERGRDLVRRWSQVPEEEAGFAPTRQLVPM